MKFNILFLVAICLFGCSQNNDDDQSSEIVNVEPTPAPIDNTGSGEVSNEINFDEFESKISNFMSNFDVPGLQVAITENEKLVYLKSFGFSDLEAETPITDNSLFRIASISKPITAITIMKLSADNQLSYGNKVFGDSGLLSNDFGTPPYSDEILDIDINSALGHRSGWTNDPYDVMFDDPSLSFEDLFTEMIDNRQLQSPPIYYYSNFGYCVLGRIVEKVTDMTYEAYVIDNILEPMGITNMKIGRNTIEERYPDEVTYYPSSTNGFDPYSMNVERMDAHGGWVASAKDLAKFITHIDRNNSVQDILPSNKLDRLYFGYQNWIHTGSLPGTSSVMERYNDAYNYTVVMNKRSSNYDAILNRIQELIRAELSSRTTWPNENLFD